MAKLINDSTELLNSGKHNLVEDNYLDWDDLSAPWDDKATSNDDKSVFLNSNADYSGDSSWDSYYGTNKDETIKGTKYNDELIGYDGDDKLYGLKGDDVLTGCNPYEYNAGSGEYDILVGGKGQDFFVLGDEYEAYYQGHGDYDYAEIKDFNWQQGDKIIAYGSASDYDLYSVDNGVGIYYQNDLIGVVSNTTDVMLQYDFEFYG